MALVGRGRATVGRAAHLARRQEVTSNPTIGADPFGPADPRLVCPMAKYLCPTCGAVHKEYQPQCRLCGQALAANTAPINAPQAAVVTSSKGSMKGIAFIGIGLVILVIALALVFGLVSGSKSIDNVKDKVIPGSVNDGWSSLTDDEGHITVSLPGDRTKSATTFPGTKDGKITVWTSKIGTDTIITVGYGTVTAPTADATTGSAPSTATFQNFLRDLAGQWAISQGTTPMIGGSATAVAGLPAYVVSGTSASYTVNGKPAYAQQALMLKGNELIAVTVLSIYKNAEQFEKVYGSLAVS